jgi:hypothetical protein
MALSEPEVESGGSRVTLTRLWFELWKSAALLPLAPPSAVEAELRKLRSRWFSELGVIIEDSMRAALFLETMSRGLWALNHSTPILNRLWRPPLSSGEHDSEPATTSRF